MADGKGKNKMKNKKMRQTISGVIMALVLAGCAGPGNGMVISIQGNPVGVFENGTLHPYEGAPPNLETDWNNWHSAHPDEVPPWVTW